MTKKEHNATVKYFNDIILVCEFAKCGISPTKQQLKDLNKLQDVTDKLKGNVEKQWQAQQH